MKLLAKLISDSVEDKNLLNELEALDKKVSRQDVDSVIWLLLAG